MSTNGNNLSAARGRPVRTIKKPNGFMTICPDLKPPYTDEVAIISYQVRYFTPQFQNLDCRRGNTGEHVFRFLDSMGVD